VFLKKIIIQGFKSFADRVVLEFDRGMTGVVGPNGCGKSNIADAFLWVTGEQSAKSVRGDKMADVIFAGTSKRKPLNFAEVTLVLTDLDSDLGVPYKELEITRRLYRSGESEYRINGQLVRLRDIQSLLLDTGHRFANIGQGQVERMVMSKPHERRAIFEEAAGIARFRQRRKEAKTKLEQMNRNLERLEDIQREVESQVEVLGKQAKIAKEFQTSKHRLENLEKSVLYFRWKGSHELLTNSEEQQNNLVEEQKNLKESIFNAQEASTVLKEKIRKSEQEQEKNKEGLYSLKRDRDLNAQRLQRLEEDIKKQEDQEGNVKRKIDNLEKARLMSQEEFEKGQGEVDQLNTSFDETANYLKEHREEYEDLKELVVDLRDQYEDIQEQRAILQGKESSLNATSQQEKLRLESQEEQLRELQEKQFPLKDLVSQLGENVSKKSIDLENQSNLIDRIKGQLKESLNEQSINEQSLEISSKQYRSLSEELTELIARKNVLEKLKEEKEGISKGSKELLEISGKPDSVLYEKVFPLYERILPKKGFEDLISRGLGSLVDALIVETKQDLEVVWKYLEEHDTFQVPILCLENLDSLEKDKVSFGIELSDFVEKDSILNSWDSKTYVVENFKEFVLESSNLAYNQMVVGKREGSVDTRQILFLGKSASNHIFAREAQLQEIIERVKIIKDQLSVVEKELGQYQLKKGELQKTVGDLDLKLRQEEMKIVEVNFTLQSLTGDLEKYKQEYKQVVLLVEELEKNIDPQRKKSTSLEQEYRLLKQELEQTVTTSQQILYQKSHQEEKLQELGLEYETKQTLYRKLEQQLQSLKNVADIFAVKHQESEKQKAQLKKELEELQKNSQEILKNNLKEKEQLLSFEEKLKGFQEVVFEEDGLVVKFKKELTSLLSSIEEMKQSLQGRHDSQRDLDVTLAQCQTFMESCQEQLQERYQMNMEQLSGEKLALDKDLESTEKEVKKLRRVVDSAEDINMASIEEHEKQSARFGFLNEQMEDLVSSRSDLESIIEDLDEESRKKFQETFEIVRQNFKKNFMILFSGGEADLKFTQHDDILEAGIEIIAQPPGKQMRSISLLSGGEKCMTAITLLFSLFEVKPAPFCLLDEIDAPLDDSNVQKFMNLLQEFIGKTQFIVITHNKVTMESADVLFGISMQERGISKILSMSFDKEEQENNSVVEVV
jgi:chromosome segregation protein